MSPAVARPNAMSELSVGASGANGVQGREYPEPSTTGRRCTTVADPNRSYRDERCQTSRPSVLAAKFRPKRRETEACLVGDERKRSTHTRPAVCDFTGAFEC